MRLFVGLDVSLEKTAICVISEHGKIVKETHVASEPEALLRGITDQDGVIAVIGLEAGPLFTMAASLADRCRSGPRPDGNPSGERCLEGHADQDGSQGR